MRKTLTVVVDGLVSGDDSGVTLTRVDLERLHSQGVCLDTVRLDDRHVVAVDRDIVLRAATEVDEPKPVPLALGDGGDRETDSRATDDSSGTIDCRSVLEAI